jgi:hypothetical protein
LLDILIRILMRDNRPDINYSFEMVGHFVTRLTVQPEVGVAPVVFHDQNLYG